ncbi:MAG: hypothetical protein JWR70_717 [Modestobacter sp.]|jgi:hypothetical protein|nr:hypothetical protein [Modestobacter sp.]
MRSFRAHRQRMALPVLTVPPSAVPVAGTRSPGGAA